MIGAGGGALIGLVTSTSADGTFEKEYRALTGVVVGTVVGAAAGAATDVFRGPVVYRRPKS